MALPAQAVPNTLVGNYRILEQIACGGMGVVYKGFDLSLQRTVALKFLTPGHWPDPKERQRLLREARATSALDHENIAAIHHVEETNDGQLFIDMAYYDGEDLACRMRRAPLPMDQAIDVVTQVARGLAHAHSHHVIHRDIKPANVILTKDGVAKIVDFGLARVVSPDASTLSMDLAGTFAYMSPEQLTSKTVDARSDIWSLGVMFYELLLKRQPFTGSSTASILNGILNADPQELEQLPPKLRTIIARALAKDPARRYQQCTEFLRDLEQLRVADSMTPVALKGFKPKWRTNWTLVRWLGTMAAILLVAMLYPPALNRNSETRRPPVTSPAPNELYQQGLTLLERYDKPDRLSAAIGKFEETTVVDPTFALAFAGLGEAYVDKYRLDRNPDWLKRAEDYCNKAIALNNELPQVHVTMGRINVLAGKHDLGLQEIQLALKLDPLNVKGLLARGDAYSKLSRSAEAERDYLRAVALRPDDWDAYQRLGSLYFGMKRYDLAAEQYRKLIKLVPDNAVGHSNLAAALFELKQNKEAEREMKESLRLLPTYAGYYNLAWRYYTQRRYAEAAVIAELATAMNPADYNGWQMLGLCYEWTGQDDKAKAAYERELNALVNSASLKLDDAVAQAEVGLLYSKLKRKGDAEKHLQTALTLKPNDPEILSLAGEAYENFSDRPRALAYFVKAIESGWDINRLYNNPDLRTFLKDPAVQHRLRTLDTKPGKKKVG